MTATKKKRVQSPEAKEKIRQKMLAKHRANRIATALAAGEAPDPVDVAAQEAYERQQAASGGPPVAATPSVTSPAVSVQQEAPTASVSGADIEALVDVDPVKAMKAAIPEAFVPLRTGIGESALAEEAAVRPQVSEGAVDVKTVHFLTDGWTSNGKVWYRGETFSVEVGSEGYKATCDRNGKSWMDLTEADQIERYGERMFAQGPWPYDPAGDLVTDEAMYAALSSDDAEALKRLEKKRARQRLEKASVAAAPSRG